MISLIIGNKGSGKTKKLIELTNKALAESKGNVVCIEKGKKLTYGVNYRVRHIDTETYSISGFETFYGFLSGICAGNYDVTDILVDATLKIGGRDYDALLDFVTTVAKLSEGTGTNFVFTVSADEHELPQRLFEVAEKL